METKNSLQKSLPFELPSSDIEKVKQHWNITFARQKRISVTAKRIMVLALSQITDGDDGFKPFYQMHVSKVMPEHITDKKGAVKEVRKAFDELTDVKWMFEDWEEEKITPRHLMDTTKQKKEDGFECGYDSGVITIVLNPALKKYFIQLARNYTMHELKWYMTFQSWYSQRLYEILSAFKDTGVWRVSIEDFRHLMDCEGKYPKTSDMLKKTLKAPLKELLKSDMAFDYEPIYADSYSRGRKPVIGLEFKLRKHKPLLKKVPDSWYQYSDRHKRALNQLIEKWKVTEVNVTTYAPYIGMDDIWALINQWQQKKSEIKDLTAYCNSVFVKIGKEARESNT